MVNFTLVHEYEVGLDVIKHRIHGVLVIKLMVPLHHDELCCTGAQHAVFGSIVDNSAMLVHVGPFSGSVARL